MIQATFAASQLRWIVEPSGPFCASNRDLGPSFVGEKRIAGRVLAFNQEVNLYDSMKAYAELDVSRGRR
jgi:hypothetical protein